MAGNVFTGATSDAGSGQLSNQVLTAFQRVAFFALRDAVIFDQFAKVKPGNLTSPGNPVNFLFWNDLSVATTALSETVDVDAVGLSDSSVTVTPAEYGNAIVKTIRIRTDDYLIGFDGDVANILAFNLVETIDRLARNAIDGGTNEDWVGQASEAAITASDTMTAAEMRQKHAELVAGSAIPWNGLWYIGIMHPHVSYDLKSETGEGRWVGPHQYVDTQAIYTNEVGTFAGFKVVESNRALLNADGGSGTVDTYTNYFFGKEFLAKAESIAPHMVAGPVTDKLMRFQPIGWHMYVGWDTLREAALRRLLSASSIGAN